jgi:hypothetical protein
VYLTKTSIVWGLIVTFGLGYAVCIASWGAIVDAWLRFTALVARVVLTLALIAGFAVIVGGIGWVLYVTLGKHGAPPPR